MTTLGTPRFRVDSSSFTNWDPVFSLNDAVLMNRALGVTSIVLSSYDVDLSTTFADLWDHTADKTWKTAAAPLTVQTFNAADTLAGAGAQKVLVEYLDANYVTGSAQVNLVGVGTTALDDTGATLPSVIRVQNITVIQSGTNGVATNVGLIHALIGGLVEEIVTAGTNKSTSGYYTVPKGTFLLLRSASFSGVDESQFQVMTRVFGKSFTAGNRVALKQSATSIEITSVYLPEKSDVRVRALGSNNKAGSCILSGYLINNTITAV